MAVFLSQAWMDTLCQKLNSDARYAQIASKWEGDLSFVIEPSGDLKELMYLYLDLWHGTCREAKILSSLEDLSPAFTLTASYENITKILTGKLDPMQAMMIRKLQVRGNMAYMMRNVPTVLDFVRCAREITTNDVS